MNTQTTAQHPAPTDLEVLEALMPRPRLLAIAGLALEVRPMVSVQFPPFLRAAGPILAEVSIDAPDWLYLLQEHGERLFEALAVATKQPREWVEALAGDDLIRLAVIVLEVNADFFVRRMVPALTEAANALAALLPDVAGAMSSSASSPTGTAAATS